MDRVYDTGSRDGKDGLDRYSKGYVCRFTPVVRALKLTQSTYSVN